MWLSTEDYAIATGRRPRSPPWDDEKIAIYRKNKMLFRTRVEDELNKIHPENRRNLLCLIKEENSDLCDKYNVDVIIKKHNDSCVIEQGYSRTNIVWKGDFDEWIGFDFAPFKRICKECDKNPSRTFLDDMCEQCTEKPIYLNVPYREKDDAKKLGARWDPVCRKWYIKNKCCTKEEAIKKWGIVD